MPYRLDLVTQVELKLVIAGLWCPSKRGFFVYNKENGRGGGMTYEESFRLLKTRIGARFDVADTKLSPLVMHCLDNSGTVPKDVRDRYRDAVPDGFFEALEQSYFETGLNDPSRPQK